VVNALGVLAAVQAAGGDLPAAGLALAELPGLPGRGRRLRVPAGEGEALVIDEAYNANPASMRATLAMLAREGGRRIAVLGGMRELGDDAPRHHAELAEPILAAGVGTALLVGSEMAPLAHALEGQVEVRHEADAAAAAESALALLRPGDAVLVKGSNAYGLARVVDALAGKRD
jgi:UDP-N-acetylmuramoyl-tripeptide--D-alanyl-D-alanine ligase